MFSTWKTESLQQRFFALLRISLIIICTQLSSCSCKMPVSNNSNTFCQLWMSKIMPLGNSYDFWLYLLLYRMWVRVYNWSYYPVCLSQKRETSSNVFFLFSYDLVFRKLSGKNKPWQCWFLSFFQIGFLLYYWPLFFFSLDLCMFGYHHIPAILAVGFFHPRCFFLLPLLFP